MTIHTSSRFAGKTTIVTGAGSGIGKATATRLAHEGARVIATDVVAERLEHLSAKLAEYNIVTVVGDVTAEETAQALVTAAEGRVDVLANVAGIMDGFRPNAEIDDATWERVFSINVTAVMRLTRAVLPLMIEQGSGSIVNVASEAGLRGSAAGLAYTASKHAVVGMTKNNAVLYAPKGIRTNAVAPGPVITNIEAPFKSAWAGQVLGPIMQAVVPAPVDAERLAATITWLASDDSANVNGQILASDGGWSAI